MTRDWVLIDDPAPGVRRITLNRPEKRNALNHQLRGALINALIANDQDRRCNHRLVRLHVAHCRATCFNCPHCMHRILVPAQFSRLCRLCHPL